MKYIAIKMLIGDTAKYIGILVGLTFASLLITQQSAIFVGIMSRTYGFLRDTGLPDIWVMDEKVQFIDDIKPMQDTDLYRVRSVEGIMWAVPLYKGLIRARMDSGNFQTCNVIGIDDSTLIGGPPKMLEGSLVDLRIADAVIINAVGAKDKLARVLPDGTKIPMKVGDRMELNDHRAVVVGICDVTRTFQSQPVVYMTYTRATTFAPQERKLLSFICVKAKPGEDLQIVCNRIAEKTGLAARTTEQFKDVTVEYFMKFTGIPINFGMSVILGFIVGTAIAGQTFYSFTLDNLRFFGTFKAMGATNKLLLSMIILQSLIVGTIGYGLGVGIASLFGLLTKKTELSFLMPWQLMLFSAAAIILICGGSALVSIHKVIKLEPAIVFKS
ncbi:MAG: ABC transporter permease [Planctomycetes bacterium GWF2_42_9]|nr:MAG: ABC transporter permease [Planctomycetes bacterium GWF2_42_9]HAL45119.1 ABC transporter permease [Phycisphaerales bacterium]